MTDAMLAMREKTHGDFNAMAGVYQALLRVMRGAPNWPHLSDGQKTALEQDAVKTARILCGDPSHPDHWMDKAGYARLPVIVDPDRI